MSAMTWTYEPTPWPDPQPLAPADPRPILPPSRKAPTSRPSRPRGSPEPIALHGVPFPTDWALHGACRGLDPNFFLPHRGEDQSAQIGICVTCPVRLPCAEYALAIPGLQGIWGGMNERQRRRARRELESEQAV